MYSVYYKPAVCLSQEKMCEGAVLMLLGNKLDLADNQRREVRTEEGQKLAEVRRIRLFTQISKIGKPQMYKKKSLFFWLYSNIKLCFMSAVPGMD